MFLHGNVQFFLISFAVHGYFPLIVGLELQYASLDRQHKPGVVVNVPVDKAGASLSYFLCKCLGAIRTAPVPFQTQWRTGLTPAPIP